MENRSSNTPVIPLPNPGEGGPVYTPNGGTPVIPLPNPGEGGPVYPEYTPEPGTPVIPLPNPGEGGPVYPPSGDNHFPVIPLPNPGEGGPVYPGPTMRYARTRFLNAAYGYRPFRVFINNVRIISALNYASVSGYGRVPMGYQTVTIAGMDGYIYIQKSMPFQESPTTIAIINTPSGLDLLQMPDACCTPGNSNSNIRVSNLALNSTALDLLLGDGRVVYSDIRYKDTTAFKRIQPGAYQFFFVESGRMPSPVYTDIETMDSSYVGVYPTPETVASLYLHVIPDATYTIYLLSSGTARNAVQTLVLQDS